LFCVLFRVAENTVLHDAPTRAGFFLHSLLHPQVDREPFIKQPTLSCNLLMLFAGHLVHKKRSGLAIQKRCVWIIVTPFAHVVFMLVTAGFGNNTGRIFYFAAPILIFFLMYESKELNMRPH